MKGPLLPIFFLLMNSCKTSTQEEASKKLKLIEINVLPLYTEIPSIVSEEREKLAATVVLAHERCQVLHCSNSIGKEN